MCFFLTILIHLNPFAISNYLVRNNLNRILIIRFLLDNLESYRE